MFTQHHINAWHAYEAVRASGAYNMFDPRARLATGLERHDFLFVMQNYAALRNAALDQSANQPAN